MSSNLKRDQQPVPCTCLSCSKVYKRVWTPGIRFVTFDRCADCAFAAWMAEQARKTIGRVLH